jgi:hypothetical protein
LTEVIAFALVFGDFTERTRSVKLHPLRESGQLNQPVADTYFIRMP